MKFICLCYYDPNIANSLSPGKMEELSAALKILGGGVEVCVRESF